MTTPEKETPLTTIPENCDDKMISLYHSCLLAGHQGVIRTHLTIGDIVSIPSIIHHLVSYMKCCHLCQLPINKKLPMRQLQERINLIKDHYQD